MDAMRPETAPGIDRRAFSVGKAWFASGCRSQGRFGAAERLVLDCYSRSRHPDPPVALPPGQRPDSRKLGAL